LNRRVLAAAVGPTLAALVVASCSLDLDESKIGRRDGGTIGADGAPIGPDDGSVAFEGGPVGPPTTCTTNDQCVTADGCLRGKCDLGRKVCVYDVCRPQTCSVAVCDRAARACGAPTGYRYRAGQFTIGAQLACPRCAVAMYPWLVAVTTAGTVAFNVANPTVAPPQVPIVGLTFNPSQVVQSGNRIWFLGPGTGAGPSRYSVAYLDAPSDPFAPQLAARSVTIGSNRSSTETLALFPRANGGALFVGPAAQTFPSFFLEGNVEDNATFTATPLAGANVAFAPVATSGRRLLTSTVVSQDASFQLVDNAGSANPQAGTPVTQAGSQLSTRNGFASSPEGAVTFVTGVHGTVPPGFARTLKVSAFFIVPTDVAPFDTPTQVVDLETYLGGTEPDANAAVLNAGQTMLDPKVAVVAAAARENPASQTSVQFARRDPPQVISDGAVPRRHVINTPVTNIVAATASNGIAYVVAHDVVAPQPNATVYVYDPGCAP